MTIFKKDLLEVRVYKNRQDLGKGAADLFERDLLAVLSEKEFVSIIFASAPSQNEFLEELKQRNIPWNRVIAFHMDEYIGIPGDAAQSFGRFLYDRLFRWVPIKEAFYIKGDTEDPEEECRQYAALLEKYSPDIVCLGIGENTHLAFNDPPVADFNDQKVVKVVELDEVCRNQQVNDGCFPSLSEVPHKAITITIPALVRTPYAHAIVPGPTKAMAIYNTLTADISEKFPSTILRKHPASVLHIDEQSASKYTG